MCVFNSKRYVCVKWFVCVAVCGDDVCELEETCLNCPADCGVCPMSLTIKMAIGLPLALFCCGFILTVVVRSTRAHTHAHTHTHTHTQIKSTHVDKHTHRLKVHM